MNLRVWIEPFLFLFEPFWRTEVPPRATPLHIAAWHGQIAEVKQLTAEGICLLNEVDERGQTAMHYAARKGHVAMIALLALLGGMLNTQDHAGATPLWVAAEAGHRAAVLVLVALGARFSIANRAGIPPLAVAYQQGWMGVVADLSDLGAPPVDRRLCQPVGWLPFLRSLWGKASDLTEAQRALRRERLPDQREMNRARVVTVDELDYLS